MNTHKTVRLGMMLALSIVLSYLEFLVPVIVSVPGVKLGIANIITMLVLYKYSSKEAWIIMILRVTISGFLFSGISAIIFGIIGGIFCLISMSIMKNTSFFSVMGVSMCGAVSHNAGQIVAAYFVMNNSNIIYYFPYLCISGLVTGLLIGYISAFLVKILQNI